MEGDDQATNHLPLFKYDLWKLKMLTYLKAMNMYLLDIIEKGIPSLLDDKVDILPCNELDDKQRLSIKC